MHQGILIPNKMKGLRNKSIAVLLCLLVVLSSITPMFADDLYTEENSESIAEYYNGKIINDAAFEVVGSDVTSEPSVNSTELIREENEEVAEDEAPCDVPEQNENVAPEDDGEVTIYTSPVIRGTMAAYGGSELIVDSFPAYYAAVSPSSEQYIKLISTTNTLEDAVAELRNNMKKRILGASSYYFIYETPFTKDDTPDVIQDLVNRAFAHTGVSDEGDYLKWHSSGYVSSLQWAEKDGVYYCCANFQTLNFRTTADQEMLVSDKVNQIVNELGLNTGITDYEKAYRIHKYLVENVSYRDSGLKSEFTAFGCLVQQHCVCQGYAVSLYRLALAAGLDCRVITSDPADHMWNIIKVGNRYYNIDSTWDTTMIAWTDFLCGDASSDDARYPSFKDSHMAPNIDGSMYYRPSWVEAYNVSIDSYPCFNEKVNNSPNGASFGIRPNHNIITKCTPDSSGYCTKCGQRATPHVHVFDQKIEKYEYMVKFGTCQENANYKYVCVCGIAGDETYIGSSLYASDITGTMVNAYNPHRDIDRDDVCDLCGISLVHDCADWLTKNPRVESTCTETGIYGHYQCSVCNRKYWDPDYAHSKDNAVTNQQLVLPKKAHEDINNDGECDTCRAHVCGPATLTKHEAKEATCDRNGNKEYYSCTCTIRFYTDANATHQVASKDITLPALGHTGEYVVIKQPQYGEKGEKVMICTRCGAKVYDEIPALTDTSACNHIDKNDDGVCDTCSTKTGHIHSSYTLTKHDAVKATCTKAGNKEYYSCSCGTQYFTNASATSLTTLQAVTIPATGHSYGAWTITKPAAIGVAGEKTATCSSCGAKKTEPIAALTAPSKNVKVQSANNLVAYADGVQVEVDSAGYIELDSYDVKTITTFEYSSTDTATNYPVGSSMKVYFVSKDSSGNLVATINNSFNGLFEYTGVSVRNEGEQGIRINTDIPKATLNTLKTTGVSGWRYVESGTLFGNDAYLSGISVVLGSPKTANAKFTNPLKASGSCDTYASNLYFKDIANCKVIFSIRPYITLTNGTDTITLYGGIIHRSIGSVAYQNRNLYAAGSERYNYIWNIIVTCYPEKASERK